MNIPIFLAFMFIVFTAIGIHATVSYLRLRDCSSGGPSEPGLRDTCNYYPADAGRPTVLGTMVAAESRHVNTRAQVRTWADLQRFHRRMSTRLDAIRRASECRSSPRMHLVTVDVSWETDLAVSGACGSEARVRLG